MKRKPALTEEPDRLGEKLPLPFLRNAGTEGFRRVIRTDVNGFLEDDATGAAVIISQIDRHAGDLCTALQHGTEDIVFRNVFKCGNERREGADDPVFVLIGDHAELQIVSGEDHKIDIHVAQFVGNGHAVAGHIGEQFGIDHKGGNAGTGGPFHGFGIFIRRNDRNKLKIRDLLKIDGIQDRLKDITVSRDEGCRPNQTNHLFLPEWESERKNSCGMLRFKI